ncbi:MAG: glutamate--tRNA ligase [Enterobacteriaceae bacterium]
MIITRFAPSPTGNLHIGNIRTALYSWLFAKSNNGKFLIRIEDTDKKRSKSNFAKSIIKIIKWLKLDWDNKIYYQSKRKKKYEKYLKYMLKTGLAYKCFCSKERLLNIKKMQILNKIKPKYDLFCRYKKNYLKLHNKFVIRAKMPKSGITSFNDFVYGNLTINNKELDDFIICRSNGDFTYNFCCAIDDYEMKISHVIRGEDHLNNTPKQINLLSLLNLKFPKYIHLPIILNSFNKKLSKKNLESNIKFYKEEGILSESLLNYLLRLGWSYKNKEIFTIDEMKKYFSIKSIKKSPCKINFKKLLWINKEKIKLYSTKKIKKILINFLKKMKINYPKRLSKIIDLVKFRCNTIKEIVTDFKYLYEGFYIEKEIIFSNFHKFDINILYFIYKVFSEINKFTYDSINEIFKKIKNNLKKDISFVYRLIRLIITGSESTPNLKKILIILGQKDVLKRIYFIIKTLEKDKRKCLEIL